MDATRQEEIPLNSTDKRSMVPDTVVEVPSSEPTDPTHRDHLIWSLVNFMYFNPFCCSLLALVFSIRARDQLQRGDVKGAGAWGRKACWTNSILAGLFIALIIMAIVSLVTGNRYVDRTALNRIPYFALVQPYL